MSPIFLAIILVPIIEIYLLIKIGSQIGAITTILLIFSTAIIGVYYAKYEGLNTLKSGFAQLSKNKTPTYEMISGAAIAFAALLLIIPGFATDILGFLLIFPISRKFFINKLSIKFGEFLVCEKGQISESYDEQKIKEYMQWDSVLIEINLNQGNDTFECYTCDFNKDYIDINVNYRN